MRIVWWLMLVFVIWGCAEPMPASDAARPASSPVPSPQELRKLSPDLRRHLLQQGRQALESPAGLQQELPWVSVTIRARRDISQELQQEGVVIRAVIQDDVTIITADMPLPAVLTLLKSPDVETVELAQPVPPAGSVDDGSKDAENR